jgi:hypothetical protein
VAVEFLCEVSFTASHSTCHMCIPPGHILSYIFSRFPEENRQGMDEVFPPLGRFNARDKGIKDGRDSGGERKFNRPGVFRRKHGEEWPPSHGVGCKHISFDTSAHDSRGARHCFLIFCLLILGGRYPWIGQSKDSHPLPLPRRPTDMRVVSKRANHEADGDTGPPMYLDPHCTEQAS